MSNPRDFTHKNIGGGGLPTRAGNALINAGLSPLEPAEVFAALERLRPGNVRNLGRKSLIQIIQWLMMLGFPATYDVIDAPPARCPTCGQYLPRAPSV